MSDLEWLKKLGTKLWPPEQCEKGRITTPHGAVQLKAEAKRRLKKKEWKRVQKAIARHELIVEMVGTNMFGGVGIQIYEHPCQPGMDHEHVLMLTQDHLPGKEEPGPSLGACLREAWETFSELSDTEQNRTWLKQYGLKSPRPASSFDY